MGKTKKDKAPVVKKKSVKKLAEKPKPTMKKTLESKASKEATRKKILAERKSKKILTAEGWKRLMMGAKK